MTQTPRLIVLAAVVASATNTFGDDVPSAASPSDAKPIGSIGLDVTIADAELRTFAAEQLAASPAAERRTSQPAFLHATGSARPWLLVAKTWEPAGSRHQPLYFEEVNAERHGLHHGDLVQPLVSAARFFGTIPALPYFLGAEPLHEKRYTLGHYRPGACVPNQCPGIRPSWRGAAFQAAATVGAVFIVP